MKNNRVLAIFFVFLAASMSVLFTFQFFAGSNSNRPIYGSVFSSDFLSQGANSNESVSSAYVGTLVAKDNYDFRPTVMKDNETYKMWWCGSALTGFSSGDHIYYAISADAVNWYNGQVALNQTPNSPDALSVCNPSVVKVNSTYYLYYSGMPANGTNSSVFLATSPDGMNWTKHSSSNPQPLFAPMANAYITQPSVLYLNSTYYLYYSNSSSSNGTDTYLATSSDGTNFAVQNNGNPVFTAPFSTARDVKYIPNFGIFFMVFGNWDSGKIFWTYSNDSIRWLPYNANSTIQTQKNCSLAPGILGFADGTTSPQTVVYYASGNKTADGSCFNPKFWDIDASAVNFTFNNPAQTFLSSGFGCSAVTGGYNCKISYGNYLNESAIIVFLFSDSAGNVVSNSAPVANQGVSQTGTVYFCTASSPQNVWVSWKAFRQSDITLTNAITWSGSTERQLIACP